MVLLSAAMHEGILKNIRSALVREGVSISAALLLTAAVFLILPLLEYISGNPPKMYMVRDVDTTSAPETPPPVVLPQADAAEYALQPLQAPPLQPPERIAPAWTLNADVPLLRQSASLPSLYAPPGIMTNFSSVGADWRELSEVDEAPSPLAQLKPMYPLRARNAGVEGFVVLEMIVDEQGMIRRVEVVEAQPTGYFEQSALRSASGWRFSAAKKNGEPVAVRVVQKLTFKLDE